MAIIDPALSEARVREGLKADALRSLSACLAPPPPIVVETPFGDVHADSERKASEVAELLERLAPEVQAILADPAMQMILDQMSKDPKAVRE